MIGRSPQALTLVIPARSGGLEDMKAALERWEPGVRRALAAQGSLGHAAVCALPGIDGAALLIETTFTGELAVHVRALWAAIGDALEDLGSTCGMPELRDFETFQAHARERALRASALYVAHAVEPRPLPLPGWIERAAVFALGWSGSPEPGTVPDAPPDVPHGDRVFFAAVIAVRPGKFRAGALRRALRFADSLFASGADDFRAQGPGGLAALHAARFVLLPGDRLLVTALVDGPTAVFFDRLSESRAPLLSAIFSHTERFPKTALGLLGGARNHRDFRRWIRAYQCAAGIWYSAYPELLR